MRRISPFVTLRILGLLLIVLVLPSVAPAAPKSLPVKQSVLDNGLTVIVAENHASDVFTLNAWVKVGSRDETDELNGAAHFVEHLLFKGTARRKPGEISRAVESVGGVLNASTSFDYTQYFIVASSRFFDRILDIQADALMNSSFDPQEVERERPVILQELALIDDTPSRSGIFQLYSTAYSVHPYHRPVGGTRAIIARLARDQVFEFYRTYYGPANVTLVVAGDVKTDEVLAKIRQVLGNWRRSVQSRRAAPVEPPLPSVRRLVDERDVRVTTMQMGWLTADVQSPDHYVLDVLLYALGRGRGARLVRTLRDQQRLVQSIGASFSTAVDPSLFIIQAVTEPQNQAAAEAAILAELAAVREQGISADELDRAKTLIAADELISQQTSRGQASALGFAATVATLAYHETYLDRISAVTRDDVLRVANRYLLPQRYAIVIIRPRGR